jgi:hypothetical protein
VCSEQQSKHEVVIYGMNEQCGRDKLSYRPPGGNYSEIDNKKRVLRANIEETRYQQTLHIISIRICRAKILMNFVKGIAFLILQVEK